MKKSAVAFIAVMLLLNCCSCGKKKADAENPISAENSAIQQETQQPDPYSQRTTTNKSDKKTESATTAEKFDTPITTTTISTADKSEDSDGTHTNAENSAEPIQPDPLGNGAFSYDENGAVVFEEELPTDNKHLLMSAGQALFESACRFQWILTVGCPYEIDKESVVENGFGWKYYRITDEYVHSFADIENFYYSVFSERYPNEDLKMLYLEYEGNVYALNGQREMNAYYSVSKITDIQSRTDDEIFFTVENHYEGTDMNPDESYSEKETFSMVIADNKIRVGQFRLPY